MIALVAVTALFPWRLVFFVGGVAFVGPQNWLLRVYRERNETGEEATTGAEPATGLNLPSTSMHEDTGAETMVSKALKKIPYKRRKSNDTVPLDDETLASAPRPFTSHMNQSNSSIADSLWSSSRGETALSEVLVPYSPLRQERFYDWPPEPTQSKCKPLPDTGRAVYCRPQSGAQKTITVDVKDASRLRSTPISSSLQIPKKKFQLKSKRN